MRLQKSLFCYGSFPGNALGSRSEQSGCVLVHKSCSTGKTANRLYETDERSW